MISSMTAFSRSSQEAHWGSITWEIRTVNHRYLEITVRLPEPLRELEKTVREQIQGQLYRGKVEAVLKFQPGEAVPFDITVNGVLARQLANAAHSMEALFSNAHVNLVEILAWPGVLQTKETHMDVVGQAMLTLLQAALSDLVGARHREGDALKQFMQDCLNEMRPCLNQIKNKMPVIIEASRTRMKTRFEELALSMDKERFEQEMVWFAQKLDIAEELKRLEVHMIEVERILAVGGVVGRRLDFLMQELNREANTINSKSVDADITKAAIELRVKIEQMREQVQNIE